MRRTSGGLPVPSPMQALQLIQKHGSIEKVLESLDHEKFKVRGVV